MSGLVDEGRELVTQGTAIPGRQAYHVDVLGVESAALLSVSSFTAMERMGAPSEVRVQVSHPRVISRRDYLNRDAVFSIKSADGTSRAFSGFISSFSKLKTTKDFVAYEMVLKSHLARLEGVRNTKIYQHQTVPQIIESVFRRHDLRDHQFIGRLRGQYPQKFFCFQYQQDDLAFVQMLLEKNGLYLYIEETEHGDRIVIADDIDHYVYEPVRTLPYRENAGLEAALESVFELEYHSHVVPQSVVVADYNPNKAWERFRDESNVAPQDPTTYGQPYVYGTAHLDQAEAKQKAQLYHEAAIAWQVVFEGRSNVMEARCARVLRTDTELPDAEDGLVVIEAMHSGARDSAYSNRFKAIPADRRFRLKIDESRHPKIHGTLSGRVTSPDKYKYAYITAAGYYTVRFDTDFDDWPSGGESVPLRLAKPFAGALQTGFHFPALDGTEVVIGFRDGDPDKPFIVSFHHNSQAVDHITNDRRWLSRNVIRTQSNNKLRMEDWAGEEGIKLSTEHSGKSQLNLGHLVDSTLEKRGEGFELRTSGHGAIRGGQGVYITAYDQPAASGKQLDMQQTVAQLESALELAKALADSSRAAKAIPADTEAQQAVTRELDGLKDAGLLASAPACVGIAAGRGVQVAAKQNISAVAGRNADFSVMKRFTVAAGELVSIFAQKMGLKLFAAKGPVELQAQSDAMSLASDQDMTITSVSGKVTVAAAKELTLECGGAFIQLKDGNVTLGGPGDLFFKVITIQKQGAASIHAQLGPLPPQPQQGPVKFNMLLNDMAGPNGHPHIHTDWRMVQATSAQSAVMSSEILLSGTSDGSGHLTLSDSDHAKLHDAYNSGPGQVWLVYAGQSRSLMLNTDVTAMAEASQFYSALDAMGYSDQLFVTQQANTDRASLPLVQHELETMNARVILGKLKASA
ncbi:type VI secretion system Vgr family protein [Caballeronia sp. ATUFL_M2_KS44]|uniref:type VI secretion system Vgr family protein n=1 Tax=Caballeronia sp. ATUFL_M2_KS44 TaxID=2921767 RepID=UPI0020297454|nr:type VI secretion system Vgr family protein [Caballeronia sp. ATUFL_M2_KS44]